VPYSSGSGCSIVSITWSAPASRSAATS
jgi:hypothetical protein